MIHFESEILKAASLCHCSNKSAHFDEPERIKENIIDYILH